MSDALTNLDEQIRVLKDLRERLKKAAPTLAENEEANRLIADLETKRKELVDAEERLQKAKEKFWKSL